MEEWIKELREWGCDVDGSMERFLGEEKFYQSCLVMTAQDAAFEALGEALREKMTAEAFEYAHMLKGVLANVGLTPMYEIIVRIVEPLRAGQAEDLMPVYEELLEALAFLRGLLKRYEKISEEDAMGTEKAEECKNGDENE